MALSLFRSGNRDGWGKYADGTIPFSLSLFVSESGNRDGLGKYARPPPATGQRCRRGKARRWHYPYSDQAAETDGESTQMAPSLSHFPYSGSGNRDGLGKYALPLPATGRRCRRGKARRWHRVLLLSPSYIKTVPLGQPSLLFTHALPDKAHNKILSA